MRPYDVPKFDDARSFNGIHLSFRITVSSFRSRQHTHKNGSFYTGYCTVTTDELQARHALTTVRHSPGSSFNTVDKCVIQTHGPHYTARRRKVRYLTAQLQPMSYKQDTHLRRFATHSGLSSRSLRSVYSDARPGRFTNNWMLYIQYASQSNNRR